jgi:hypothetical protein
MHLEGQQRQGKQRQGKQRQGKQRQGSRGGQQGRAAKEGSKGRAARGSKRGQPHKCQRKFVPMHANKLVGKRRAYVDVRGVGRRGSLIEKEYEDREELR